jgi:hypothetical protein
MCTLCLWSGVTREVGFALIVLLRSGILWEVAGFVPKAFCHSDNEKTLSDVLGV